MKITHPVTVTHPYGIHARPSASIQALSRKFKGQFRITYKGNTQDCSDILGILSLGVQVGEEILIEGDGEEAEQGVLALVELVRNKFGLGEKA